MKTENINTLLNLLSNCIDQSDDSLTFISADLRSDLDLLNKLLIKFDTLSEGISINLASQPISIYKTKEDCIKYFDGKDEKDVIILEDKIIYNSENYPLFFQNLIYSFKIKNLIEEKEVVSFHDKIKKKYILLSETNGKIEVGYKNKIQSFYDEEHNLEYLYNQLVDDLRKKEYVELFRNNFIKSVEDEKEILVRFIYFLDKLGNIIEKTNREYNLYVHNFSFDEFTSKFQEEKDKYFKNFQDSLSDFLSKVNSLPIQFGVYIYLLFRFEKDIYPLYIASILIIVWSIFSFFSISIMKKNIKNLYERFEIVFNKVLEKSILEKTELDKEKISVNNRLKNFKLLTTLYQFVVVIFTLGFLALAFYFIIQIEPSIKIYILEKIELLRTYFINLGKLIEI